MVGIDCVTVRIDVYEFTKRTTNINNPCRFFCYPPGTTARRQGARTNPVSGFLSG